MKIIFISTTYIFFALMVATCLQYIYDSTKEKNILLGAILLIYGFLLLTAILIVVKDISNKIYKE